MLKLADVVICMCIDRERMSASPKTPSSVVPLTHAGHLSISRTFPDLTEILRQSTPSVRCAGKRTSDNDIIAGTLPRLAVGSRTRCPGRAKCGPLVEQDLLAFVTQDIVGVTAETGAVQLAWTNQQVDVRGVG